ncbi:hypothetical protein [Mesorhizobium sp.]|uniref:hypothetical protein n=1 Tax=Mesorhizobium sp. TaxID=1871066 RepID=UPI0012291F5D|nr:hypothetical protein [Mesorhizobium sp.]TIT00226.1 MAG: hypothetical protein E5W87_19805 [Mesorhizobium sp.]
MALQLWVNDSGHYFVDTTLGGIQVGQTWCTPYGDWAVEVNDEELSVPDLEAAKRLFVDLYDRSQVVVSPFAVSAEGDGLEADFKIIDLRR